MITSTPLPYSADAVTYFAAIHDLPWAIWLDSSGRGRYDILCAQPVATLLTHGASTEISDALGSRISNEYPFDLLRLMLNSKINAAGDYGQMNDTPFAGGALGYWGYDLARRYISLPDFAQDNEHLPDMAIGIYDWAIVLDHLQHTAQLVSQHRYPGTAQRLPQIVKRLQNNKTAPQAAFNVRGRIDSNFNRVTYESAFNIAQQYLRDGDCYQVNLAQRYVAAASGDALEAYLALRQLSPSPYSAFMSLPQLQILCASPECFLKVHNGLVETKPIKGTRPRNNDPLQDKRMAMELQQSEKDRAENLMIVDLLRNDLGKCCVPGSVQVPKLFEVESYAQVHHLVSTVTGKLAPNQDAISLLKNCFPGGSITGAPKQRAMQIIEQIEPNRRGIYCGTIGYIGYDGNMQTNIVIRTLVYAQGTIRYWAGGGLVADSNADAEYQETLDKTSAMLKLLQRFGATL
ncbi:MAG: aminodeoxychorismate synthase component I [Candidatus Nitrotoga sp.]